MNNFNLTVEIPPYLQSFNPTPSLHRTFAQLNDVGFWVYFVTIKENGERKYLKDKNDDYIWCPRWYENEETQDFDFVNVLVSVFRSSDYELPDELIDQYRIRDRARLQELEEEYARLEKEEEENVERSEEWAVNHLGHKLSLKKEIEEYRNSFDVYST